MRANFIGEGIWSRPAERPGLEEMMLAIVESKNSLQDKSDVSDERLLELHIKVYHNSIDYISMNNEITPAHIENLNSIEVAADGFIRRVDGNPELAKKAGGLIELDKVARKLVQREYLRIDRELERREQVLEEALAEYESLPCEERYNNLEILLKGVDELIKLGKLANSRGLEEIVDFRSVVQGKLDYAVALKRRKRLESGRVEISGSTKVGERDPIYNDILGRTRQQLEKIGSSLDWVGVLDEAGIKSMFEVRGSCYSSIEALGLKTPVPEIEQAIEDVKERDIGFIDRFIDVCEGRKVNKRELGEAIAYKDILGVWESYL